jgi:F-type H+-transporting ATPase subunit delta
VIARTMGRRYSKALMALALEKNEPLGELQREIDEFSGALSAEPKLMSFLTDPNVLLDDRTRALEKILAAVETRPLITYLSRLLLQKGRLLFLSDIAREFQQLVDTYEGVIRASVVSAKELPSEETETIRNLLQARFGKKIVLSVSIDPELIGGLVIKVGSLSFDGSIRSQLKDIQSQLLDEVPFS